MSNRRYIEVDSTYRNREEFPFPGSFEILLAQSGTSDAKEAVDPVCNAAPIDTWIPSNIIGFFNSSIVIGHPDNTGARFLIECKAQDLRSKDADYYIGYPVSLSISGQPVTKISEWNFVSSSGNKDLFWVTVTDFITGIPQTTPPDDIYFIWENPNDFINGIIFVPDSVIAQEAYVGYHIWNDNLQVGKEIKSYDPSTGCVGFLNSSSMSTWKLSHTLQLSKNLIYTTGQTLFNEDNVLILPNSYKSNNPIGNFVQLNSYSQIDVDFTIQTNIVTSSPMVVNNDGTGQTLIVNTTGPFTIPTADGDYKLMGSYDNATNYVKNEIIRYTVLIPNPAVPHFDLPFYLYINSTSSAGKIPPDNPDYWVQVSQDSLRLLVQGQTNSAENGIFAVANIWTGPGVPWKFTRTLDFDRPYKLALYYKQGYIKVKYDGSSHRLTNDLWNTPATDPLPLGAVVSGIENNNTVQTPTGGTTLGLSQYDGILIGPPKNWDMYTDPVTLEKKILWDNTVTYTLWQVVSIQIGESYTSYFSIQNVNIGNNPVTSTQFWSIFGGSASHETPLTDGPIYYMQIMNVPLATQLTVSSTLTETFTTQRIWKGPNLGITSLDFSPIVNTSLFNINGYQARIVNYDSVSNAIQVNSSPKFAISYGSVFKLYNFSYENAVPLTYTGSLVSQQQEVCYELELINLVLPNSILTTGGRIAFYPYVYFEFQNISGASAGTKNIIYSNNPHSKRMLFRCAIDDIPNPLISPYIKIDGDGMIQTVKFKPNDNFKFGVYLPDGTMFQTVAVDTYSPANPHPLLQISAMLSFRRLL